MMSIVQTPAADPAVTRWSGYALAAIGTVAPFAVLILRDPPQPQIAVLVAVLLAVTLLALIVLSAESFIVTARGGSRQVFNYVLIVPVISLVVVSNGANFVHPEFGGLAAAVAAAVAALAGVWTPRSAPLPSPMIFLLFLAFYGAGLGWGATMLGDRFFDASPGQVFPVTVESTYTTWGRGRHFHVQLAPWGPVTNATSMTVAVSTFDDAQKGVAMCARLHPGALGLAWYHVGRCD
jgi:hypothetical protein